MNRARTRLTFREYAQLPEDKRFELIEGELYWTPSPGVDHQAVAGRIYRRIASWLDSRNRGRVFVAPLDVVLSEENVVQPDVFFVSRDRLGIVGQANVRGAPDLVVERVYPAGGAVESNVIAGFSLDVADAFADLG